VEVNQHTRSVEAFVAQYYRGRSKCNEVSHARASDGSAVGSPDLLSIERTLARLQTSLATLLFLAISQSTIALRFSKVTLAGVPLVAHVLTALSTSHQPSRRSPRISCACETREVIAGVSEAGTLTRHSWIVAFCVMCVCSFRTLASQEASVVHALGAICHAARRRVAIHRRCHRSVASTCPCFRIRLPQWARLLRSFLGQVYHLFNLNALRLQYFHTMSCV